MDEPIVTIVVVPRERFSLAPRALETLYENTAAPFRLVYVDGGSPAKVRSYLEAASRRSNFQLQRTEHYLSPNQARNVGLRLVRTPYVVFIDNDVLVVPGWLDRLLRCAEETGAAIVGPLYLMGELSKGIVHMAGGTIEIESRGPTRVLRERHRYPHTSLASIEEPLTRRPTDVVEFHCLLARVDALQRAGGMDEQLLSANEHVDLCMAVRQSGGAVYLEPKAVVTYIGPHPLAATDLPYFLLRWSEAWNAATIKRFNEKWDVTIEDEFSIWLTRHRRVFLQPVRERLEHVVGCRGCTLVERILLNPAETTLNRIIARRLSHPAPKATAQAAP